MGLPGPGLRFWSTPTLRGRQLQSRHRMAGHLRCSSAGGRGRAGRMGTPGSTAPDKGEELLGILVAAKQLRLQ